ncbi:DUF4136 domain-containing protein [Parasphingorhabdus sp.]|uniref:DUF4136 domain-containing protein n=1 Tax=Parasphingorhabdus sp. TaxID=2709688 RepID=UPI002F933131
MPPANVTRFHNAPTAPITTGTISIMSPAESSEGTVLEYGTYTAAVRRELQRIGYTELASGAEDSEYVARISVQTSRLSADGSRSPVSVGVGGSTGSYGSGIGVGIGINLSGKPKDKIATELSVRISRRADNQAIWEGRSWIEAKAGSPGSQPALAASKLAEALFKDFPGESGTTITVP